MNTDLVGDEINTSDFETTPRQHLSKYFFLFLLEKNSQNKNLLKLALQNDFVEIVRKTVFSLESS